MTGKWSSRHHNTIEVSESRKFATAANGRGAFLRAIVAAVTVSLLGSLDASATCKVAPSEELVGALRNAAPTLNEQVLRLAMRGATCAAQQGLVKRQELLTVIDYSMPSTQPRLFVFDLRQRSLLFRELVAHGKNSGGNLTKFFSNREGSLATSIGLFVTGDTYMGSNGYSLRLLGLDKGYNDQATRRAIVMHGASYVSDAMAKAVGRIGRSWGCPAVRKEVAEKLINTLKGGSAIFSYYPDTQYLQASRFLG